MLIRSASGLRGIVEDDFNSGIIDQYIASFILTQKITHCVIGRDGRQSGREISQWVIDSLIKYGVNVDNCDLATTPTMQLMTEKEQYDGGIVITASHNPSEYNGLKFLQKDGTFLSPDQCNTLFVSVDNQDTLNEAEVTGKVSVYNSANEEHITKVLSAKCIEPDTIRSKKFKVVIDAVNGGGSTILPQLCSDLRCDVITINCDGDGNFNRVAEPLAENLQDLEKKVLEVGADIGFATDPDGDRLSIVSNKGRAIGEEYTLVLSVMNFYRFLTFYDDKKGSISYGELGERQRAFNFPFKRGAVTNLSTSQMIDDFLAIYSISSNRTKIGEAHVVENMKESNIWIGGEGNGGVILKEVHLGRDSLVAAAMVLNLLSSVEKSINEIIAEIPEYVFVKDKITLNDTKDFDFDNLATLFDCDEINRDDGIKFSWSKKWIHIRKSNTEPIIRIFSEAKTESEVNDLIQTLKDYLK
ncbi:MAG TPA: phosphoglucosamine mutase [Candidatus Marinimicrobia bacterium]|jgi:phosphomannomutase|nr:phosphoglucosamine mutase [Candidatus Neomarinimicrobiota bacterium]